MFYAAIKLAITTNESFSVVLLAHICSDTAGYNSSWVWYTVIKVLLILRHTAVYRLPTFWLPSSVSVMLFSYHNIREIQDKQNVVGIYHFLKG